MFAYQQCLLHVDQVLKMGQISTLLGFLICSVIPVLGFVALNNVGLKWTDYKLPFFWLMSIVVPSQRSLQSIWHTYTSYAIVAC